MHLLKQPTTLVSNITTKLVNLQAVQGNDLAMRLQTDMMEDLESQGLINIIGQRVDETYFIFKSLEDEGSPSLLRATIEQAVAKTLYPDGRPMFKVVRKPIACVPNCPLPSIAPKAQQTPRLTYQPPPKTTWQRFTELEIQKMNEALQDFDPMPYEQRIARQFYNNKCGLLTGAAGTGKTYMSDMIVERITEKEPQAQIIRAALTHVAALLQKGQTIAHIIHKYLRETDAWFIFDEVSMIPSQLMGHIARWKLMGNKIILIGDFKGQFLPVHDRWGGLCGHRNFGPATLSVQRAAHRPYRLSPRHRPSPVQVLPRQALPHGF